MQAYACNFIKKETPTHVFSCEFCKAFKNIFFTKHLPVTISITTNVWPSDKRSIQFACRPINLANHLNCWRQLSLEKYFSETSKCRLNFTDRCNSSIIDTLAVKSFSSLFFFNFVKQENKRTLLSLLSFWNFKFLNYQKIFQKLKREICRRWSMLYVNQIFLKCFILWVLMSAGIQRLTKMQFDWRMFNALIRAMRNSCRFIFILKYPRNCQ